MGMYMYMCIVKSGYFVCSKVDIVLRCSQTIPTACRSDDDDNFDECVYCLFVCEMPFLFLWCVCVRVFHKCIKTTCLHSIFV